MDEQSLIYSGLFAFFTAYSLTMFVAYKNDPRFSLKISKKTSVETLLALSLLERALFFSLLIIFSLFPPRQVYTFFSFSTIAFDFQREVFLGVSFGLLTFILGIPFDALILLLRRKFSFQKTEREEKLAKLVSFSSSRSKSEMILKVLFLTLFIGFLEEIIFRGYLLYHLARLFPLIIVLIVQAFVYFTAYLYQGVFKSLQTFLSGFMFGVAFFFSGSLSTVIIARITRDTTALTIQFTPRRKS